MPLLGVREAHPDRYRTGRLRVDGVVLHTSEQTDPGNAGALTRYLQAPGDRPGGYGSSYTYVVDADGWWRCVAEGDTSFSAPPCNNTHVHACFPGQAAKTRAQWLTAPHRARIRQAAALVVDVHTRHKVPLVRVDVAGLQAGQKGYCGHVDVTVAFHKSDHTDPGTGFPWDVLAADIAAITAPAPPPPPPPEVPLTQGQAYDVLTLTYGSMFGQLCGNVKPSVDPGRPVVTQQDLADVVTLWHAVNPALSDLIRRP
jgi:hypothetical protein